MAMKDQCPHRLAALSEGRMTSKGDLQCSYHVSTLRRLCLRCCTRLASHACSGMAVLIAGRALAGLGVRWSHRRVHIHPTGGGWTLARSCRCSRLPADGACADAPVGADRRPRQQRADLCHSAALHRAAGHGLGQPQAGAAHPACPRFQVVPAALPVCKQAE